VGPSLRRGLQYFLLFFVSHSVFAVSLSVLLKAHLEGLRPSRKIRFFGAEFLRTIPYSPVRPWPPTFLEGFFKLTFPLFFHVLSAF